MLINDLHEVPQDVPEPDMYDSSIKLVQDLMPAAHNVVPPRKDSWALGNDRPRITRQIHHRVVIDFTGKPLKAFKSSKQLMQVVSDAFTGDQHLFCAYLFDSHLIPANQQSYERNGPTYCDISPQNILINQNGHGILNDFDLVKPQAVLGHRRIHERYGTWQFMSSLLLEKHHSIHMIQDDMESFIYVMLYFGLRYLEHNSRICVSDLLARIFDDKGPNQDGFAIGGMMKIGLFTSRTFLGTDFKFSAEPFQAWWEWAFYAVRQWIKHSDPPSKRPLSELELSLLGPQPEPKRVAETDLLIYDHSKMAEAFFKCVTILEWPTDERPPVDAGFKRR
ncbi:hypothetical protein C0995_004313 [Termitomyces sp. Mi166|nr:hypothetical protein C0995_004313 [Termitomyces sp. Mi166\